MRHPIYFFVVFLLMSCPGCQVNKNTGKDPESVARIFFNHLVEENYEEAALYGTEKTFLFLEMMQKTSTHFEDMSEVMINDHIEAGKPLYQNFKILELKEDSALVACDLSGTNNTMTREKIQLIKKEGRWLVDMDYK